MLAKAFKTTLSNVLGGSALVLDYDNRQDFITLWDSDESGTPRLLANVTHKAAIVIAWEGAAGLEGRRADTLLAPHLTPLDWALAFSNAVIARGSPPDLRIHIIDLTGKQFTDAWAIRMRHQLLAEMPWVTLHAPLIPKELPGGVSLYRDGYLPILGEANANGEHGETVGLMTPNDKGWQLPAAGQSLSACAILGRGKHIKDLAKQWAATLIQNHDHHDLNNIIGPWMLAGVRPAADAPILMAFNARLEWLSLLEHTKLDKAPLYKAPVPLNVVVIDDELDNLWDIIHCRLLGLDHQHSPPSAGVRLIAQSGGLSLFGSVDPRPLSEWLGVAGRTVSDAAYRARQFDSPIQHDRKIPWMLVLDLYLFAGRFSEQKVWFRELLEVARLLALDASGLAWPSFSEVETTEVDNWLKGGTVEDGQAYETALSLFPRLCALRWPSVPIIIFSATGRRLLLSKLAKYGNIVFAVLKPNLFAGNASEQVAAFVAAWQREFASAAPLISVQRKLVDLELRRRQLKQLGSPVIQTDRHHHLTIAFDEAGDFRSSPFSAIGGVIVHAEGKDKAEAHDISFRFFESLRKNGVNFYDHPPVYAETGKVGDLVLACKAKNDVVSNEVGASLAEMNSCRIMTFRCLIPRKLYSAVATSFSDEVNLTWLSATIELLMAEYLFAIGYTPANTSFAVWLPTRSVDRGVAAAQEAARYDFDIHLNHVHTIGGYSIGYALITSALSGRKCLGELIRSMDIIRVRRIPYYSGRHNKYVSALHWYCPHCSKVSGPLRTSSRRLESGKEVEFESGRHAECRTNEGHKDQYLFAEYTVAAHLADASLSFDPRKFPDDELGDFNVDLSRSVDVYAGEELRDFLRVGRLLDRGLHVEAIRTAYQHDFFVKGLNRGPCASAPVERRLVEEIAAWTEKLDGSALIGLGNVSLASRGMSGLGASLGWRG